MVGGLRWMPACFNFLASLCSFQIRYLSLPRTQTGGLSMSSKGRAVLIAGAAALLAGSWAVGDHAFGAAAPFKLTSATFRDGTMMPTKIANKNQPGAQPNPNCVGENDS